MVNSELVREESSGSAVSTVQSEQSALVELLDAVRDPEIPVLSIRDLGVLRDVRVADGEIVVSITPTYSGCPAMDTIRADISAVLNAEGYVNHKIQTQLSPAWTTDWMSQAGREKLEEFGIAPPGEKCAVAHARIRCPRCQSEQTTMLSEFGSTACKSMHQCNSCKETFCYFKAI